MHVICLDYEGVLIPELWETIAQKSNIPELTRTTRDEPDYTKLMQWRIDILHQNQLTLADVVAMIADVDPLPGAKQFLDEMRAKTQVFIVSDSFYEFAAPTLKKLGLPAMFCHWLTTDNDGYINNFKLRQDNPKHCTVQALQSLQYQVKAAGDSYNDIPMLEAADAGVLFRAPDNVKAEYPHFAQAEDYQSLTQLLS